MKSEKAAKPQEWVSKGYKPFGGVQRQSLR